MQGIRILANSPALVALRDRNASLGLLTTGFAFSISSPFTNVVLRGFFNITIDTDSRDFHLIMGGTSSNFQSIIG